MLVPSIVSLLALPAEAGVRCVSPLMRSTMAASGGANLAFNSRPNDVGFVDSDQYPIRVHYRLAADETRARTVVLPAVEESWRVMVDEMGWPAPPSDQGDGGSTDFDAYLTNEGTFGGAYAFGFGPDMIGGDEYYSVPSFIALDDKWITDKDMLIFVSHEFNHAAQYATDGEETYSLVWEATAEAMAELVDDDNDSYFFEIPDFQVLPFESLLFMGTMPQVSQYDNYSFYEYGGMLFPTFLEERYGHKKDGTQLLALWTAMAEKDGNDQHDFVDALGEMDPENPSAAAVYTEFAEWRMFASTQDDGAHFEEGGQWGDKAIPAVEKQLKLNELDGFSDKPEFQPYDLGTSYYRADLGQGTDQVLHVEVNGDDESQWGLAWAVWHKKGAADTGTLVVGKGDVLEADIPLLDGTAVEFGVVNAGPKSMTADSNQAEARSFKVTLSLADPPDTSPTATASDTGSDPAAAAGTGCGCDSGPSAPSLGWLAFGALGLLRRRPSA